MKTVPTPRWQLRLAACAVLAGFGIWFSACGGSSTGSTTQTTSAAQADRALDGALHRLVHSTGGPPGLIVVVQRGSQQAVHTAGVAMVGSSASPTTSDHMRIASVAKAFSGAAALALVEQGKLSLDDTVGRLLPNLPTAWHEVTLAEALQHRSGLPDYTSAEGLASALQASPLVAPPPTHLLSYVSGEPLEFTPGARYHYSNSDNIVVGLMVEAVTGESYEQALQQLVYAPLGLTDTSLPATANMPSPYLHGYDVSQPGVPVDGSELFAPGWAWAAGGIVSTPADLNRFIRGYASGATTNAATLAAQRHVVPGSSEPPGPGTNLAGLGIFEYRTSCGIVYGHTGNTTGGYTQFAAASGNGQRSVTVTANTQLTPSSDSANFPHLQRIFELGVCDAMAG
jgi:D-alanyl-D-alanine carboxypeptidase